MIYIYEDLDRQKLRRLEVLDSVNDDKASWRTFQLQ